MQRELCTNLLMRAQLMLSDGSSTDHGGLWEHIRGGLTRKAAEWAVRQQKSHWQCHDPAPIFHFPPPPQVLPTMPSPPVTQPAHAQQAPVQRQSPASIPLPPSPPPIDICPPSLPHPTLAHLMPQLDVPNLADAYM